MSALSAADEAEAVKQLPNSCWLDLTVFMKSVFVFSCCTGNYVYLRFHRFLAASFVCERPNEGGSCLLDIVKYKFYLSVGDGVLIVVGLLLLL